MRLSKNFDSKEFLCKCGCGKGEDMISPQLIFSLQQFRDFIKLPIKINSGFRCPEYNKQVGGAANSYHLKGMAADISVLTGQYWLRGPELISLLHKSKIYFGGVGVGSSYLHLDVREIPDFWFYEDVLKWADNSVYFKKSLQGSP